MMQLKDETSLNDGKYQIVRYISSGDFGFTYEALCTRNGSRVAIKEFFLRNCCERHPYNDEVSASSLEKAELFDKMKKRFLDEAQTLFQFNHPNIVHVTDVFRQNGTAYYVMGYVEGVTLKELVNQKGRLSEQEALSYMDQLCDAISYVHSKNRLHLDIRPANMIISSDGRVNLVDFGFSKRLDPSDNDPNVTTLNVSTNSYSPIELRVDSDASISSVSDVYSLGATLYTLLTGNIPPDAAMLLEYPLSLPSDISPNVALAIKQAMSPNKSERPQSANDFRRMLHTPIQTSTFVNNNPQFASGNQDNQNNQDNTDLNPNLNIGGTPYNSNRRFGANPSVFPQDEDKTQLDNSQEDKTQLDRNQDDATELIQDKHAGTDFSKINFGFEPEPQQGSERTFFDPSYTHGHIGNTGNSGSTDSTVNSGNNTGNNNGNYDNNQWGLGGSSTGFGGSSGDSHSNDNNGFSNNSDQNDNNTRTDFNNNFGGYGVSSGDSGLIVEPEDLENESANISSGGTGNEGQNSIDDNSDPGTVIDPSRFDIYANDKIGKNKKKGGSSNSGLKVAVIIAAILILGAGGYWAYNNFLSTPGGIPSEGSSSSSSSSSSIAEATPGVSLGSYAKNNTEKMGQSGEHLWVDLGLPSGTKWSTSNIGADSPTDFGGYYAWGETDTKNVYNFENAATYEKPMGDIAGNPTFDVATKLWGESWRLPTKEQYEELLENCNYRWVEVDDVKGGLFTSKKNGQSIFLPAAGFRYGVMTSDTDASYVGMEGAYWTDTPIPNDTNQEYAYGMRLYGSSIQKIDDKYDRSFGRSIRPVTK